MKITLVKNLFREITEELKAGNQMRLNIWVRLALALEPDYEGQGLINEVKEWAAKNPKTNFAGLVKSYIEKENNCAFDIFKNIVENYDPKKDAENLAKTREYLNALLNRGNINEQIRHKPESALTDYATANMLITKSGPLKNELTNCLACVYFYMACLILKDSRDGAAELFTEASELGHPRAKRSLANLLRATEPEQAEQLLLDAASLGDYPAHLELGRIKRDKGDNKAAKQNYLSALDFGDNEAKEELFALLKTEMMSEDAEVARAAFAEFTGLFLEGSDQYQSLGYSQARKVLKSSELQNKAEAHYWLARIEDRSFHDHGYMTVIYHYYRALKLDASIADREIPINIHLYEESIRYCIMNDLDEIKAGNWQVHPKFLAELSANGDAKKAFATAICQIADQNELLATLKYAFTPGSPLYTLFATARALFSSRAKINAGTFLLIFESITPDVKKKLSTWLSQPNNSLYEILGEDEKAFLRNALGPDSSKIDTRSSATRGTTITTLSDNPQRLMVPAGGMGGGITVLAAASTQPRSENPSFQLGGDDDL